MKDGILLFVFLNLSSFCYCQSSTAKLVTFYSSTCDQSADIARIQQRIINQQIQADLYSVTVGTVANCAGIHAAMADLATDTLKISYEEGQVIVDTAVNGEINRYVDLTTCDCCFDFTFTVQAVSQMPRVVTLNGEVVKAYPEKYKVYPIQYIILNGDTINLVDKYGLKQRYWYEAKEYEGYFKGYYVDDELKTSDSKEYYSTGKLKSLRIQTNFDRYRLEEYFESGGLASLLIHNDTLGSMATAYYEDGTIRRIYLRAKDYDEEKVFYPSGQLEKLIGNGLRQMYYPNGELSRETLFSKEHHIWEKFYYEDGRLMAVYYLKTKDLKTRDVEKRRNGQGKIIRTVSKGYYPDTKRWWKCYDTTGKRVSKDFLVKQGYTQLQD